jgi:hypothetical protein
MERAIGLTIEDNKIKKMVLSPTGMKKFDNCPAGFIYSNVRGILPKIDTSEMKTMAAAGRALHNLSELDFDKIATENILSTETEAVRRDTKELASTAKERDYVTEGSQTEVYLTSKVKEGVYLRGYADRISSTKDGICVIDLKSTGDPRPYDDRPQVLSYAFSLVQISEKVESLLSSNPSISIGEISKEIDVSERNANKIVKIMELYSGGRRVDPADIILVLDYVRRDMVHEFKVTTDDFTLYRNYVISTSSRIKKTIESFLQNRDISTVEHCPGSCGFCPMKGICVAYTLISNPHPNPLKPEAISTNDLIRELIEVDDIWKRSEARSKVIKAALMARDGEGDKKVTASCIIVRGANTVYPTAQVVLRLIPKIMKKAVKNIQFKDMIDWEEIYRIVTRTVISLSPANLRRKDILEGYEKDVDDLVRKVDKKPYIKLKG